MLVAEMCGDRWAMLILVRLCEFQPVACLDNEWLCHQKHKGTRDAPDSTQ